VTVGGTGTYSFDEIVTKFRAEGRIAIVGASLAGLRAAEALRDKGFNGSLTIIGDEPHEPYDRPPLSKQVLKGWVPADHTKLPRLRRVDADWKLGVAAVGLDRINHVVKLANGEDVEYDRLLIATGTRARPWPNPVEGALQGVFTVRTVEDAAALAAALKARPKRVLIVGSGFVGSEIASVCRDLDLPVTVAERGKGPLMGALGGVISEIAAGMMRDAGVDLRTGVAVEGLEGEAGHVRRARLSDGNVLDVDVVVASLGSIRNVEWLDGAGLAAGQWGLACDAGCRAFDINGVVTDHIFVAGDVARAPHVLYVRGEHQERRGVLLRRRDRLHPGIAVRTSVRGGIRQAGPHRRRGHLQPRQVVAVLRLADREVRAVPASAARLRRAGGCATDARAVPRSA
jgi:NADPH-dependent 2,4-dienoyl-CoA reductase/sulfur reductase-like enzyme